MASGASEVPSPHWRVPQHGCDGGERRNRSHVLTICALTVAAVANAQTPPAFAAIRHVNLSGNGAVWVALAGQLRERVESGQSFNFGAMPPATVAASDVFVPSRALMSVELPSCR